MPPVIVKLRRSALLFPRSTVIAPLPWAEATLNEYAFGGPTFGVPRRLKRIRSIALASVAVPTRPLGAAVVAVPA